MADSYQAFMNTPGSSQVGDRTGQSAYPYDPAGDVVVLGEHARFLIDLAEHSCFA
jgi:hypothetical protein